MCLGGVPAHWRWGAVLKRDSSWSARLLWGSVQKTHSSDTRRGTCVESDLLLRERNTSSKLLQKNYSFRFFFCFVFLHTIQYVCY